MDILGFYTRRTVDRNAAGFQSEKDRAREAMRLIADEEGVYFVRVSKGAVEGLRARKMGPVVVEFSRIGQHGEMEMRVEHYTP